MSEGSSDAGHSAIDRIFDSIDRGVDMFGRLVNHAKASEVNVEKTKRIETPAPAPACTSALVAKRTKWRIIESCDAETGNELFIVTDGGNARAECTTRELAQRLLRTLESSP